MHYKSNIRFPEFSNGISWRYVNGGDLFKPVVNKHHNSDLPILAITQEHGAIPRELIDYNVIASEKSIAGYKVVEIGDFIISLRSFQGGIEYSNYRGICSPAYIILRRKDDTICNDFYRHYFKSYRFIRDLNRNIEGIRDGKMISYQQFSKIRIPYPMMEEQQKIAECLSSIDTYIFSVKEKTEQLKVHRKSLLQKLFPQNGKTVPEYRFPEFQNSNGWEKRNVGAVTVVVNRRNKSNRNLPIYSISNVDGFVPQSEQFDGLDSKSRGYDISLYKVVGKNTFAYNPARINTGSIGYSGDLKEVLISSLYVCFKTTDEIDDEFMMCFLNTAQFGRAVENNVEGGIRSYLFYDNFSKINIRFPSIREQKKISSVIKSIDNLLAYYQKKATLLENQKKGLLQQLFPTLKN